MNSTMDTVVANLNRRRFIAARFQTNAALRDEVLRLAGAGSVGIGGSSSVRELSLYDALIRQGNTVYCHSYAEDKEQARLAAMNADCYLCSANAITESGVIINVDGTGNRVAATLFGPPTVIIIAGANKLSKDIESGIARLKRECCPLNARRLGLNTPCAATGTCADCRTPARMCNATTLLEYPTRHAEKFYVLLSDESLGW